MIKFSVRKPLTVFVAALAILILGVVAFIKLTPDLFPNMDFPYVIVMTAYPGASPESVEEEVTKPLEQSMATLEHLKNITSTSNENYSLVMLEFEDSVNMDTVGVDIQQNLSAVSGSWSDSIATPYVLKINPSVLPVEVAAVSMSDMDVIELSDFVEDELLPKLEGVTGVAGINAVGTVTRRIHVVISEDKIADINRRLAEVVDDRLNDAIAELEDTKAELENAKEQLSNAESQLSSGKDTLISQTASAEAAINQQQVALLEGRIEIQQQLVSLNETRSQLQTTLSVLQPILERLDDVEVREADATERAEALEGASEALLQADAALAAVVGSEVAEDISEAQQEQSEPQEPDAPEETPDAEPMDEDDDLESVEPDSQAEDAEAAEDAPAEAPESEPAEEPAANDVDAPSDPENEAESADAPPPEEESPAPEEPDAEAPVEEDPGEETPAPTETPAAQVPELPSPEEALDQIEDYITDITETEEYIEALQSVNDAEAALQELGSSRFTVAGDLLAAETELAAARAELALIDSTLEALDMSRDGLADAVTEMESGLAQADAGIGILEQTLDQLDDGTVQLSDAMSTLSQTKSEGLLQLANAATQLAVNAGTVDSALAQVDSGLTSIEDSREGALASADITERITLSTVSSILTAQNFSMPAGYVQQDGVSYMVSVGDELSDEAEIASLLVFDSGKDSIGPVYMRDVADIFITDDSDESYAKLNGDNGLILTFQKQSNAATAEVTEGLGQRFRQLEAAYPGLQFVPLMDQGDYIRLIVKSILESLLFGAVFAILVLFLFLRDIRPTLITLVSIPISLVFAVVLMYFTGVTLNMISLSGLAVSVGMLVDNSIVVIENIYRLRSKGANAIQAAVAGTKQVAGAITASTLTTVCVFLPIVFVEGITRQLFTDLALTMGYSLMASLLIALTLVPAMARGMLNDRNGKSFGSSGGKESVFYRAYRKMLDWSLRRKWVVLPLALILLVGSTWAAISRGFSFMPEIDMNTVSITVTMPEDATREEAVDTADRVLQRIQNLDDLEYVGAMMGGSGLLSSGESYDVTIYVGLPEGASGAKAGAEIADLCGDLPCEIEFDSQLMDMSYLTGSGITVNVYGSRMEALQESVLKIAGALEVIEGVTEVDPGLEDAEPALHIAIDRNAAMEKGYTVAQVYGQIASYLTESTTALRLDMENITADVLVESDAGVTSEDLMSMELSFTDGNGDTVSFPLSEIAELEDTVSLSSIQRDNQRRYLSVNAAVSADANLTQAAAQAQRAVAALDLPSEIVYEFNGENETVMESVGQLLLMLLLGIVLVYFIMVAQFQSLKGPFIVMFTIPLAFTGGFLALLICGLDVSIVSLVGFVMLTGIIVNNGIVLVDYVNQLRAEGMPRREALTEAGVTRMRPIFMTSLTTVLGLIVMAFGNDVGTAMMQPVAVVCIGGLLYATLMTLVIVPCIYDIMSRKEISVVRDEDMQFEE